MLMKGKIWLSVFVGPAAGDRVSVKELGDGVRLEEARKADFNGSLAGGGLLNAEVSASNALGTGATSVDVGVVVGFGCCAS
jgi:hypothetical protein